ncbi:macrophage mannose receptor 1-like [Kryptolebias marmoratus]|uniref:macrophage mannose receptor 1-like n=1 Tax=Kryptolebias marmoratus TaxID=37003 RepID=UPI0018ACF894|nr:macrophage mannose receptor 1-like [Kryptolebias marmoratus]
MEKVLLFFTAASALTAVSSLPARSFYFVYEPKNWTEAQSYCREKYTDLATIESMEDVDILDNMKDLSQMVYPSDSYRAWFGLYDDVSSWRWSMSDSDFYQHDEKEFRNWRPGQPDNYQGNESCSAMYSDGSWTDVGCSYSTRSVCFDVKGPNSTFVLVNTYMNWTEAQSYCREHHTDLASVRNEAENQKVKELIPSTGINWIGLYRDTWKWVDGSSSSFRYWGSLEPDNYNYMDYCAVIYFQDSGRWEDWNCDDKKAFICQNRFSQKVVKLKLINTSSVDLNDPQVLENLLKQSVGTQA